MNFSKTLWVKECGSKPSTSSCWVASKILKAVAPGVLPPCPWKVGKSLTGLRWEERQHNPPRPSFRGKLVFWALCCNYFISLRKKISSFCLLDPFRLAFAVFWLKLPKYIMRKKESLPGYVAKQWSTRERGELASCTEWQKQPRSLDTWGDMGFDTLEISKGPGLGLVNW